MTDGRLTVVSGKLTVMIMQLQLSIRAQKSMQPFKFFRIGTFLVIVDNLVVVSQKKDRRHNDSNIYLSSLPALPLTPCEVRDGESTLTQNSP